ncbi:MAG TPA: hypothetical protein VFG14_04445 [Chthoniobacteraceae bacterium]|nr:hypothetical protein [Chthoniobacteraceae bacterium]
MKAPLRVLLAIVVAFLVTGCFQVETVVSVKPDGSGTVTETMIMPKAMVEQMKQMTEGFAKSVGGDAPSKDAAHAKRFELMDEKKLKDAASKMGSGVSFVSAKKISNDKGEGFVATYAFTDINQLRVDQNPSDNMPDSGGLGGPGGPGGPGAPGGAEKKEKSEPITFQFKKGKVAELIVTNPVTQPNPAADKKAEKPDPSAAGGEEMAMMMMQQMFKDMKMVVIVEVAGKIVKTNAEHVAGNRTTLMEMDFNKIMANPAKFKELSKANPKTVEETKALVKGIDGIKVETKPAVSIQFQ